MTILGDLFSKLVKQSQPSKDEEDTIFDDIDVKAYFNIAVSLDDEVVISSDFSDDEEEAMTKLVFLICSGTLMETIGDIVDQRCDDVEQRDRILSNAYNMILNNMTSMLNGESVPITDDDEPLVDPCFVFRQKSGLEDENDTID